MRTKCRACWKRRKDFGTMCQECAYTFRRWAYEKLNHLEVFRHACGKDGKKIWVVERVDMENPTVAVAFDQWVSSRV